MSVALSESPSPNLLEEVDDQIVEYYLQIDSSGEFIHPPGHSVGHLPSEDVERIRVENVELHEFILAALGVHVPRTVVVKGHRAPFDLVADLFFSRVKNALGFANRNGGKTQNVAILNFLDMLFRKSCEVASAGAVLEQANKCYRYFKLFMRRPWFDRFCDKYEEVTGKDFLMKSIQSWTEFGNGSTMEVLTGTEKGLRSPHPNKFRLDEVDLISWSLLQTALSMAKSGRGIRGQNVFTSTRQKERGSMQRLLNAAAEKGIEVYEWNIWEVLARCERRCFNDPQHGDCPIYCYCKGKAHHCDGFYETDDFIDKVRVLDRETWEVEWENKKPARSKLVYHKFSETKHIMDPKRLYSMFRVTVPQRSWPRVGGLDFGASPGHPFVYIKLFQMPNGAWLWYHEYVAEQRLIRDHAIAIKSSPFYLPGEKIFADWDAQDRVELRAVGVRTFSAKKDVRMGVDYLNELLSGYPPAEEPMLYMWFECPFSIDQMSAYAWPICADGRPDRSGNPEKYNDDAMDAGRYALYSLKHGVGPRYQATTIVGI